MKNLNKYVTLAVLGLMAVFMPLGVQYHRAQLHVTKTVMTEATARLFGRYFAYDGRGHIVFQVPSFLLKAEHANAEDSDSESEIEAAATCAAGSESVLDACEDKFEHYASPSLQHYHNALCRLNRGYLASAEQMLCEFASAVAVTDFSSLPIDSSVEIGEGRRHHALRLVADAPTEEFALEAGYVVKATLTIDDENVLVIYWDGSATFSKGFLIENNRGHLDHQASYVQWDLTDSSAQSVKVAAAQMRSGGFLGGFGGSEASKDAVLYGEVEYNADSSVVALQALELKAARGNYFASLGCFKTFASGVKGGELMIARNNDNYFRRGIASTDTHKDATYLIGLRIEDATDSEEADAETIAAADLAGQIEFSKSCADLKALNAEGGLFHGNDVNFTAAPADVF